MSRVPCTARGGVLARCVLSNNIHGFSEAIDQNFAYEAKPDLCTTSLSFPRWIRIISSSSRQHTDLDSIYTLALLYENWVMVWLLYTANKALLEQPEESMPYPCHHHPRLYQHDGLVEDNKLTKASKGTNDENENITEIRKRKNPDRS